MKKQITRMLMGLSLSMAITACGKSGFQASTQGLSSSTETGLQTPPTSGDNTGGVSNPDQKWTQVEDNLNGKIDQSPLFSGRLALEIDRQRQAVVVLVPFSGGMFLPISSMPLPQLNGASIEMRYNADGSQTLGVVVPLKYLLKGANFADYSRLPNGEPLPGMPVGEARGFAIDLPQKPNYRLHFYVAVNAVAVYVEASDFKLPSQFALLPTLTFPIKDKSKGKTLGYFALVPNRGTYAGGVYVSTRIPNAMAVLIDELLKY